jgi:four helix bundle protein
MTRSAVSIPSNIAEGSAKKSVKEQVRFIEIALGSAFELETQALVVQKRKWVEDAVMNELIESVRREQRMISKFIEKLEG